MDEKAKDAKVRAAFEVIIKGLSGHKKHGHDMIAIDDAIDIALEAEYKYFGEGNE